MNLVTITNHKYLFDNIARAFIRTGATSILLLEGDDVILKYPREVEPAGNYFVSNFQIDNFSIRIHGLPVEIWQPFTDMVFELFSNSVNSETELESLTVALVETQDRLVAFYDLSKANRLTLEITPLLELLVGEAYLLLNVLGSFAIFTQSGEQPLIFQKGDSALTSENIDSIISLYQNSNDRNIFKCADSLPNEFNNLMLVLIPVRKGIFALLGCFKNKESEFTSPDIKLAKALSINSGAQLENALLLKEALEKTRLETEMSLAHQVQTLLLPQKLPQFDGFDLHALSQPAREVGGDFFDIVSEPEHPIIFLLGDVTGKGMAAALLMSMTRTVARSAARNMPFTSPNQLMNRLNVDLHDDFSQVSMFTTAFIGIINQSTLTISYCNAGQSPIIYVPANKAPVLLEAADIPIGIFDGYEYSTTDLQLSKDDVFVVASDGFPESRGPSGEMYGYTRLLNYFSDSRHLTAQQMVENLMAEVTVFSGSHPQDDDCTIIVIKIR